MRPFHSNPAFRMNATGPSNERQAGQDLLFPERTAVKQGD